MAPIRGHEVSDSQLVSRLRMYYKVCGEIGSERGIDTHHVQK